MRNIKIYSIIFIFIILPCDGCVSLNDSVDYKLSLDNIKLEAGISNHKILMGESSELLFSLSCPKIETGEKVPFVIALHFAGRKTPHFAENYLRFLVDPALKDLNAIIFAPDSPNDNWNNKESENVILQFLDKALKTWPIDPNKIVITGYSNGGNGTWYMIDKHSYKFSAAIPMAALPNGRLKSKVPTYIIHGKRDELFDWKESEKAYRILNEKGAHVRIEVGEYLSHYQVDKYIPLLKNASKWLKADVWD